MRNYGKFVVQAATGEEDPPEKENVATRDSLVISKYLLNEYS